MRGYKCWLQLLQRSDCYQSLTFLLPEDRQRLQFGGMLVSSFGHVFAYIISQRPPFPHPVPLPFGLVMTHLTFLYHSMGLLKVFLRFKLFLCILML
jgi:hypothetical protein